MTMDIMVEKLSIVDVLLLFIVFVVLMLIIGFIESKNKKKAEETKSEQDIKNAKFATLALYWFPCAYVIFLLIYFYVMMS